MSRDWIENRSIFTSFNDAVAVLPPVPNFCPLKNLSICCLGQVFDRTTCPVKIIQYFLGEAAALTPLCVYSATIVFMKKCHFKSVYRCSQKILK